MMNDIFVIHHISAENDLVVLTNGMFFSDKMIDRLKESLGRGKISFQISLDGPTADAHDKVRGPGSFAKTVPGIRRIVEHRFDVTISTAINRHNLNQIAETTQLVGGLGVRAHHLLWMQEWGRAVDHKAELLVNQVTEAMQYRTVGDEIGVVIDNDASLRVRVKGKYGRKTDLQLRLGHARRVQRPPGVSLRLARRSAGHGVRQRPGATVGTWRHSTVLEEIRGASVQKQEEMRELSPQFRC